MGLTPKDTQGKRCLVPELKKLAIESGIGFIIAFDADAKTNKSVRWEEKKLIKELLKYNVPVLSVTGLWNTEDGKGMDDFIQKKGIEEFRRILTKAYAIKSHDTVDDFTYSEKTKLPSARQTSAILAEDYSQKWKFSNEQKCWRAWTRKEWEKVEDGDFRSLLKVTIDAKCLDYKGSSYIRDVLSLLTDDLRMSRWQMWDRAKYINFSNLVLDNVSGKTLEHSSDMGFTSHLPYPYKPLVGDTSNAVEALQENCPHIYQWMSHAMKGDRKKMLKLLAVVNGLLRFRFHDLQMFVHLVGSPGTGKGTFSRLLMKVVGRENWKGCKLGGLNDGSKMASIIDKQLVVFPDERVSSSVDSILSLTGGDPISYREVYKPAADAFFYGLLLICSNNPIFVGDTTGLDRRLCLVSFDNPVPTEARDSAIEEKMDGEIAQLIAVAITLTDSLVTENIKGVGASEIAEFKAKEWEMKTQTNSVAAFFDECLIVEASSSTTTGKLYDSYKHWCESGGLKPVSIVKFPKALSELCFDLHLSVKWNKGGRHVCFDGLRLRHDSETQPTYSEVIAPVAGVDAVVDAVVDAGVAPIPSNGLHQLHQLQAKHLRGISLPPYNFIGVNMGINREGADIEEIENVPPTTATPATTAQPLQDGDSNYCTTPASTTATGATVVGLVERIRQALEAGDCGKARELAKQIKADVALEEQVKAILSTEENHNLKALVSTGLIKGTRVRYVGDNENHIEQYGELDLVVDEISFDIHGVANVACRMPNKSFTT